MSGFTDEERAAEAARRAAADQAKDRTLAGPTGDCVHCGRSVPLHEISAGLCDYCFHKD